MADRSPEGSGTPSHVDIPEYDDQYDDQELTPEQIETDEHYDALISDAMAEQIREMISHEIVKAQEAVLPHIIERLSKTMAQIIKEELDQKLMTGVTKTKEPTYKDFSVCQPPTFSGEQDPFKSHRWIQDVEGAFDTSGCPEKSWVKFSINLLRGRPKTWWNYTLSAKGTEKARNMSWTEFKALFFKNFAPESDLRNIRRDFLQTKQTIASVCDFTMTFLDRARFLPEYASDERLLMNHYVDMLRKDIRQFISAKDWKNIEELTNAALERERESTVDEEVPPKRKVEQGSSSRKKVKPTVTQSQPRTEGRTYPQCNTCGKYHLGECRAGSRTCFSCGESGHISKECPNPVKIEIDDEKLSIDLIPIPMGEINVIIGMDWLGANEAAILCRQKLVRLRTPSGGEAIIYGERKKANLAICTYARTKRYLAHGCQAYLAYIVDSQKYTPGLLCLSWRKWIFRKNINVQNFCVDMADRSPEGSGTPSHVDIPEYDDQYDDQKLTPEQIEIDEHYDALISDAMAEQIREMISHEIVKAQEAALPHIIERLSKTMAQIIKEELDQKLITGVTKTKEPTYKNFSVCQPPTFSGEQDPFKSHRWIQDVEGAFDTSGCPEKSWVKFSINILRGRAKTWWNYTLSAKGAEKARNMSWTKFKALFFKNFAPESDLRNICRDLLQTKQTTESVRDFTKTFLDRARFLTEYASDERLLMNHYVDMLHEEVPPKRKVEQGSSSRKKVKPTVTQSQPRTEGRTYPQCNTCGKYHLGECRAGSRTCFSCGESGHICKECLNPVKVCQKCYQPNQTTENCPNVRSVPPPRPQEFRKNVIGVERLQLLDLQELLIYLVFKGHIGLQPGCIR
ncbi:zinc finger, CCHC-type, Retrotransposon gag domain protein [Artemisia annua]|uniref:Zinc finger, CCHC-type, Retrotransposon gag domain protein n=1 Tax=Artemisia annua TaxID=35608 RepID=A0A2U1PIU4_ARTAN|nr:zinc finger, CCHC-type, Retrotransposon gag domain protein [Artemisia annua]